jgi:hypothetical protein
MGTGGVVLLTLILLLVTAQVQGGFSEHLIKCKVCERAVEHVWTKGQELRRLCKHAPPGLERDIRCDFENVHAHAIEQMAWGVCDALPVTYKAIHESDFDLVLHDDPQHPAELAAALRAACIKFLHDEHGAENIGTRVHEHLEAGQVARNILPTLRQSFCRKACAPEDRPTPLRPERLYDDYENNEL